MLQNLSWLVIVKRDFYYYYYYYWKRNLFNANNLLCDFYAKKSHLPMLIHLYYVCVCVRKREHTSVIYEHLLIKLTFFLSLRKRFWKKLTYAVVMYRARFCKLWYTNRSGSGFGLNGWPIFGFSVGQKVKGICFFSSQKHMVLLMYKCSIKNKL